MGLEDRLRRLEGRFGTGSTWELPDWPFHLQATAILDTLEVLRWGGSYRYPATDREIAVLAAVFAEDLPEDLDTVVLNKRASLEDLPEAVRSRLKRMDPAEQPERDRWLYARRHDPTLEEQLAQAKRERERFRIESLKGSLRHFAMLEQSGIWWQDSEEAHRAAEQRARDEIAELEGA